MPDIHSKKKCPFCHERVDADAVMCINCGATLKVDKVCPKCKTMVDHAATLCPACGFKLTAGQCNSEQKSHIPISSNPQNEQTCQTKKSCPNCNTEDCAKVSVAFESGTSTGEVSGIGFTLGGDAALFGGTTNNRTLLAKRLAPPAPPRVNHLFVLSIIAVVAFFYGISGGVNPIALFVAIILGGLVVPLGFVIYSQGKKAYPKELARWERLWVCLRCGRQWEPSADNSKGS